MANVLDRKIQSARKIYQPLFSTIELTQSCNLKCKHCYNFDRESLPTQKKESFPPELVKRTIYELYEIGALSLAFTGGEPLLYPHLNEVILFAMKYHFHIRIKSNATLVTEKRAEELYHLGVKEFDISLYGVNEKQYLDFTGKEGYEKTLRGIHSLKKAGIVVNLGIILHRQNVEYLDQFIQLAKSLDCPYQISDEITDRYDKTMASQTLAITQDQYEKLLDGPYKEYFNHKNPDKALMCGCAKTVIGIGHRGDVYPCIGSPIPAGNIHSLSLVKIWNDSPVFKRIRDLQDTDFKKCQDCELITDCSRSSGSAYINTGEYTGCDPLAKEFALARFKKRNRSD